MTNWEMMMKGIHLIERASEDVTSEKEIKRTIATIVMLVARLADRLTEEDEETDEASIH